MNDYGTHLPILECISNYIKCESVLWATLTPSYSQNVITHDAETPGYNWNLVKKPSSFIWGLISRNITRGLQ